MSIVNIKRAFEKYLETLLPAIETAQEGVSYTPKTGIPYQDIRLVPRMTQNPSLGTLHYRETGEFQIFLAYPKNKGTTNALQRAELIKDFFKRGTTLVENSTTVLITRTPQITGTTVAGDRIIVPVIITYISDISL